MMSVEIRLVMKTQFFGSTFIVAALILPWTALAEETKREGFDEESDEAKIEFRAGFSKQLNKADRVVLYLVDFDTSGDEQKELDEEDSILIGPKKGRARILDEKELKKKDRAPLLELLSDIIAEPEHSGGAFCHFPIHGIRIYRGKEIIHEGTFCWVCKNFGFTYPVGSQWLDTSPELEKLFQKQIPVPKKELDRFYEKFPSLKPQEEEEDKD